MVCRDMTKSTGQRPRYGSDLATKLSFYTRPDPLTGCHTWVGALHNGDRHFSYGTLRWNGKPRPAHRLAWELVNGPIPDGIVICHRCDNPKCVNPQHLFAGTQADNVADRDAKGRNNQPKGIHSGRAKLTEEQVLAIRADPRGDHALVAADYNVSRTLIRLVRQRRIWTHI